jgi:hypothetical protein
MKVISFVLLPIYAHFNELFWFFFDFRNITYVNLKGNKKAANTARQLFLKSSQLFPLL